MQECSRGLHFIHTFIIQAERMHPVIHCGTYTLGLHLSLSISCQQGVGVASRGLRRSKFSRGRLRDSSILTPQSAYIHTYIHVHTMYMHTCTYVGTFERVAIFSERSVPFVWQEHYSLRSSVHFYGKLLLHYSMLKVETLINHTLLSLVCRGLMSDCN